MNEIQEVGAHNHGQKETQDKVKMNMEKTRTQIDRGQICKRCKHTYSSSFNSSSACRYHPSFFVCRRHDDQKRYYELGPDDPPYAAKFYDCCGAEDPEAPGCTTDFHLSYDA